MIHGDLQALAELLLLTPAADGSYCGGHPKEDRYRVYGGQLLGQGLLAGCWGQSQPVRSFHATFVRAGSLEAPISYSVDADPTAPEYRCVTARQAERVLFLMDLRIGGLLDAGSVSPPASKPDDGIPRERGIADLDTNTEASWAVVDSPFDNRFVEDVWRPTYRAAAHNVWFRGRGNYTPAPDAPVSNTQLHQAMLAYYADDTLMDNALFPHGWLTNAQSMQTASLDHCMWFHHDFDPGEWLLYQQDSPVACNARGMTRGRIVQPDGTLIANACQEIFMRPVAAPATVEQP